MRNLLFSAFAKAYPDTVDEKFKKHWESWFSQDDVDQFVELGLNVVRIPVRDISLCPIDSETKIIIHSLVIGLLKTLLIVQQNIFPKVDLLSL
ncbi:hypothetical protein C0993_006234 [Termitomyces sp. T159_Od127]|nr:hypothetical protein C0993_006234 [Termitomyces sp. T159_Od127]